MFRPAHPVGRLRAQLQLSGIAPAVGVTVHCDSCGNPLAIASRKPPPHREPAERLLGSGVGAIRIEEDAVDIERTVVTWHGNVRRVETLIDDGYVRFDSEVMQYSAQECVHSNPCDLRSIE